MSKNIASTYAKNDYLFLPLTKIKKDIFCNAAKYKNLSYIPIFDNVLIFKNLDEIKITFDKSNIDYYNLLIVLKNMCSLEFTTNDFLFQLKNLLMKIN